ncbi:hypothetical protein EJ04DRAFT_526669 [Polyplosphaeria fusca]|uniref:Uncharacterized protein n=1 Tax=Polyplosphaeria fusca TaxID=682080 RepID=A0A9P4UZ77_9PLEO|nr:hypothetical protein EJ04DRAFT_526669 [Polyplosphaeria fusca]
MSQNPTKRLRNTPRRASRLSMPQIIPSRASPLPISTPSRRRADRRRPINILSDSDASAYETDSSQGPSRGPQFHGRTREARRRASKVPRIAQFEYNWVNFDRIPGYTADERQVRRRASYWLYGVPLVSL